MRHDIRWLPLAEPSCNGKGGPQGPVNSSSVASVQEGCGGTSSPDFWGPSISETLPQEAGSFFPSVCGVSLSASLAFWGGVRQGHPA